MAFAKNLKLRGVLARALMVVLLAPMGVALRAQRADHAPTPMSAVPEKKQQEKNENDEFRMSPTVQKLGGMMGMKPDAAATAFEVLNFLILLFGIGYMLLKMLPKAFRNRNSSIQKDLVSARTATEEAATRLGSVEARLAKLDDQIAAMRHEAEQASVRDELRIKASVEDEKARIVAAAEAEILSATTLARREIQSYAAGLAIEHAARRLQVSAETDRLLIENFASKLGETHGSEN